jgi:FKBP-type peptidyl-prolyl cis-trans isomerase (trigger factor)
LVQVRSQKDFLLQVETLAEKQIKEEVVIDQIAYNENLTADSKDIEHYLHFFNNKRLQKFVYFMPSVESIDDLNAATRENIGETSENKKKADDMAEAFLSETLKQIDKK